LTLLKNEKNTFGTNSNDGSSVNKKNYKEKETLVERGTKRFQERLVEEKEAEQELKDYEHNIKEEYIDDTSFTFP